MVVAADPLCSTPAEHAALARLRELTGVIDGPMERHGVRCFLLAREMARRTGKDVDREVLLVACLLHDAGLYLDDRHAAYVTDGRRFATEFGFDPARERLCADTIEHHHEPRPQWTRGAEVEFLRRADLVELVPLTTTLVGLDWPFVRRLRGRISPRGLYRHIAGLLVADLRRGRPPSDLARIFRP